MCKRTSVHKQIHAHTCTHMHTHIHIHAQVCMYVHMLRVSSLERSNESISISRKLHHGRKNLMWDYYTNVINSCRHSIFRDRRHLEFAEDTFLAYTLICKVQCYEDLVCQAFL